MFKHKLAAFIAAVATACSVLLPSVALAVTPTLQATLQSDNNNVQLDITGDPNSSVILYYTKTNVGSQTQLLGTTSSSGILSTTISSTSLGVASESPVYITVGGINGPRSANITWPTLSNSGNLTLSQTAVTLQAGQSTTVTANNVGTNNVYVSNNSNPPVANINVSGTQITISAISNGSTVANMCMTSSPVSCASVYVTVSNGSVQALSFSMTNVTVTPGQNVPITVSGGTGSYSILNNSNSGVIQASISGSVVTLYTSVTSGSAAITVCSSNMSSCGIINATAGATSTSPIGFSQTSPTISAGQSMTIALSGGSSSTYYVSANSNTNIVQASLSGSTLTLTGLTNGTSTVTVCSSTGACGQLQVTVTYVSNGGALQLSQATASLLVGQVLGITVTGGMSPYNLGTNSGTVFQAALNGNILTISAVAAGSGNLQVCSAGGACINLSVTVSSSGAGTPMSFSQSTVALSVGASSAVTITGAGGYYVSTNSNSAVASVQVNGSTVIVTGLQVGNNNVSICQTGGQCSILFVNVTNSGTSTSIPTFSQVSPAVVVGQTTTVTISGGSSSSYYVSANSNPTAAALSIQNNTLTIAGQSAGSTIAVICASSTSCAPLTILVNANSGTVTFTPSSPTLTVGQSMDVTLSGGVGYSLASNNNQSVASAQLNGTTLTLKGISGGTSLLNICQSNGQCSNLTVTVSGGVTVPPITNPTPTSTPSNNKIYINGQLIKEKGTVYIVFKNTKVKFANMAAFNGLGYKASSIITVDDSGLVLSERVVTSGTGAHPRGTWLLHGKLVYFLTPDGLIPIPTWEVFLNNGGNPNLLIKANKKDLAFPTLSPMTMNDARLK